MCVGGGGGVDLKDNGLLITHLTSFGRNRLQGGHQLAEKYSCMMNGTTSVQMITNIHNAITIIQYYT